VPDYPDGANNVCFHALFHTFLHAVAEALNSVLWPCRGQEVTSVFEDGFKITVE